MSDRSNQGQGGEEQLPPLDPNFRPLTRTERRNLWLKEYGKQDIALQFWVKLAEQTDQEFPVMFQMHGQLVFGQMISTLAYARFHVELYEGMYRQEDPDTADFLREFYTNLVPPADQPEIGPAGLPVLYEYVHLRDITIISGGHKTKLPYWRGRVSAVEAFVLGATTE
ncbi:hypothetical protein KSC_079040 [Ktedonobacter sp. SOSP1-52]|uniref:hypothetical protein n=1 Tax=Ktedonobacter sp. SOSP1-52 TaxID=2778366 RepID=UPI00191536BB|nr:hypothetical protein [Ktedonobacter sp. SOSP1-52]GHO69012.1 hypothetical protein KSC_079040 [Ktedonobacter sp. SOSP1-52]